MNLASISRTATTVFKPLKLAALVIAATIAVAAPAQAEAPAVYMQRVANELIAAQRKGSVSAFEAVIKRHGAVSNIARHSLGQYWARLAKSKRNSYYATMVRWIARYATHESRKYPVVRAVVVGQTKETKGGVFVDSAVTLKSGTTYDVRWWLMRWGSGYRVRDADVLGFSAADQLQKVYTNFLSSNGGKPETLMARLNQ